MPEALPETADVETSSDDYARRFAGPVGEWFLGLQERSTLELLAGEPGGARILDVGGGHAQIAPALVRAGFDVVVLGSAPECAERLRPALGPRCRFEVGNVVELPYAERSFDVVVCFRLLPHVEAWRKLVGELCRTARRAVVIDYPSSRSVNVAADALFSWKKRIEKNTRPFKLFRPGEIRGALAEHGFGVAASRPQFLWPMALHRAIGSPWFSKAVEAPPRVLGLTARFGSPIIVAARRELI
jgi:2-polyprenyl-3-methyl-5-hydroxy-6-metoxy-1,4-benzoquinol methylase